MDLAEIQPFLKVDCDVQVYGTVNSTNIMAKEIQKALKNPAKHNVVLIAEEQTAGHGRRGRAFFSPPGHGIYMSLILDPAKFSFKGDPTMVTIYTAVAVCEAIEAICGKSPGIKWVNDLFMRRRKICGISAEALNEPVSGRIESLLIGIGINFTLPVLSEELSLIVGAVFENEPTTASRGQLAAEIINRMIDPSVEDLLMRYRNRLFILNEKVRVEDAGLTYEATVLDINDKGHLVVQAESGERITLMAGEVSIRTFQKKV